MRLEARERTPLLASLLAPVGAVAAGLTLCAVLVAWSGAPVLTAYGLLFRGALGSGFALAETLSRATPLILTRLAPPGRGVGPAGGGGGRGRRGVAAARAGRAQAALRGR